MQVQFIFDSNPDDYSAAQIARLFLDIRQLMVLAIALADERGSRDWHYKLGRASDYGESITADQWFKGAYPEPGLVVVKSIKLQSPLKIKVGLYFRGVDKALEAVVKIFEAIITPDHIRRRAELENIAKEETLIRERMKTYEKGLRIAERIGDPVRRADFEQRLEAALLPFVDGRYPPLKRMSPPGPRK